jgi:mono/diheme cytochrome c family protein
MKIFTILLLSFSLTIFSTSKTLADKNEMGECPQKRKTKKAPRLFYDFKNPLLKSVENKSKGKLLYEKTARPLQCILCHGINGNGVGDPDFESTPKSRNFTCKKTMTKISDGQLFWIIKNGSAGTSMPEYTDLNDKSIWQLIIYIREFSN